MKAYNECRPVDHGTGKVSEAAVSSCIAEMAWTDCADLLLPAGPALRAL